MTNEERDALSEKVRVIDQTRHKQYTKNWLRDDGSHGSVVKLGPASSLELPTRPCVMARVAPHCPKA